MVEHTLHHALATAQANNSHLQAQADLCNIAFYFLLRVGEYTHPRTTGTRNTKPFAVKNVTFWNGSRIVPNTASLDQLLQATSATIVIPRQTNGVKGQSIHQQCTGTRLSPIKSLARRVHHIMHNFRSQQRPIYWVKNPLFLQPRFVTPDNINHTIRLAAHATGLFNRGYEPSDVSSHSLRAGGAMALHLAGADTKTIMKMGRWKSDTFRMYIHEQISAFSAGLSTKMSQNIPFVHIAGPRTSTAT